MRASPPGPPPRNPLVAIERCGYAVAPLAVLGAALLWGAGAALPAAAGAAIACLDLRTMRWLLGRAQRRDAAGDPDGALAGLLAGFGLKMVALLGAVYVAVAVLRLAPDPFALGLGTLVVALVAGGIYVGISGQV